MHRLFRPLLLIAVLATAGTAFISCDTKVLESPTKKPNGDNSSNDEFVILFTNDFHSQIEPINNYSGGIKRMKALIDSVRTAEPHVLLADAGDQVQGTFYFSLFNGVVEMMILNELGYDIRTLGNHEFDKSMVGLGDMLAMSSVPVVASNYDFTNTSLAQFVETSKIINAGSIKVGFIGMNVMLDGLVDPTTCEGVEWQNAINVADDEAKKLLDQGADMVIALSHLGYKNNDIVYYDRGIAMNTRHIDMIIGGHSHTTLRQADYVRNLDGEYVPIVQTGSKGYNLGYAKIKLHESGRLSFDYRLIPVTNRLDNRLDPVFSAKIDNYSKDISNKMNEVLGYCPNNLYKGNPESLLGNITADGMTWAVKEFYDIDADISIYNSGGMRASFYKGNITVRDVYAVYPFDNVISVVKMKGRELKNFFDTVASYGGMPINKEVRLVISNDKVKSVTINGASIVDDKEYTIATINYLVNTEDYFKNVYGRKDYISEDGPVYIRDYMVEYFRHLAYDKGNISASLDGRIIVE